MTELVWVSIVRKPGGGLDCEVLDAKPTATFINSLRDAHKDYSIVDWEIRSAYVNGGDSQVAYSSFNDVVKGP